MPNIQLNRRQFLKLASASTLVASQPAMGLGFNVIGLRDLGERSLTLHNVHTGEKLKTTYWANGEYDLRSLKEVNHILRDHRQDKAANMAPSLIDTLHHLYKLSGSRGEIYVVSGYRSPETNNMLRDKGHNVARNSMHTRGKAIDIRLDDVDLQYVKNAALSMKAGGVGYYPKNGFVHIDVGRIRQW